MIMYRNRQAAFPNDIGYEKSIGGDVHSVRDISREPRGNLAERGESAENVVASGALNINIDAEGTISKARLLR